MTTQHCFGTAAALLILLAAAAPAQENAMNATDDYTVACYYFPNYHVDPRNEAQHGPGWTEWELVRHATPRFEGHDQPKEPAWGYTDEADPEEMARKIDAAADHGIDAFIFDWYYYEAGKFLERGVEQGFMKARNNDRLKFGLMWANHDWKDIQPAKRNAKPEVQFPGVVAPETFERMTAMLIADYFPHPSYWRIEGKPYFSFYDLTSLMAGFGSIEATREALDAFRAKAKAAGLPGVHLNAVVWGRAILPGEQVPGDPAEIVDALGFDSVTSYVWIHHVHLREFPQTPYGYVMEKYFEYAEGPAKQLGPPYYPNVTMGWDSSPRACQSDVLTNEGYPFMASISENTPAAFKQGLERVKAYLDAYPEAQGIFNINCWNEWTEGSYLEPDKTHGMAYLEAIRNVFGAGE